MNESSKKNSIRNVIFAGLSLFVAFPVQFINRFFLIKYFGIDFLGLTGVFNSIIGMVNLADLGISSAVVFALFKPVATKDWALVRALLHLFKKVYFVISGVVLLLGLAVVPFLSQIIGSKIDIYAISILYVLYVIGAGLSYSLAYYQTILIATEKNYLISKVTLAWTYILLLGQLISIVFFNSKLLYVIFTVVLGIAVNITLRSIVRKNFPEVVSGKLESISKEYIAQIKNNVFGNFVLRLSGVIVTSTDSLMISMFVGLSQVGIYSNYLILTNFFQKVIVQLLGSLTGNIGVFATKNSKAEGEALFQKLQFFNYLILNVVVFAILGAVNPFIGLWIGHRFTLDEQTIILISVSFYLMNYRALGWSFTAAYGLADKMKKISIFEMAANLLFSLLFILVFHLGLKGIILGTIFSTLLTVTWQNPIVIYREAFGMSAKKYFVRYIKNALLTVLGGVIVLSSFNSLQGVANILVFVVQTFMALLMGMFISFVSYARTPIVKELLVKIKKR